MKLYGTLAATLLALLSPAASQALSVPNAQDLSGTRAMAMGDAFRAVADSNEAIYFNLAGLALLPRYEIDLQYATNDGKDLSIYNGSIVEAKARLATGIAYTRILSDDEDHEVNGHAVHLGFGVPLGQAAALGFGLKYLSFSDPVDTNSVTGDLGLLIRATRWVSLGAAVYNVINVYSPEAPRRAGLGVAVGDVTSFRVAADTVFDFSGDDTEIDYHVGGEYLLAGSFPLRGGFKRLTAESRNYASLGLGFVSRNLAAEAAYVQNLEARESADRTFSFALKLYLH